MGTDSLEFLLLNIFLWLLLGALMQLPRLGKIIRARERKNKAELLKKIDEEQLKLFKIEELKSISQKYSVHLKKMAAYRKHLERSAGNSDSSIPSHRLEKVLNSFDDWEAHVNRLVKRLVAYELDKSWKRERPLLMKKIRKAQIQLDLERPPRLRVEIQKKLNRYQKQQARLENLSFLMEKSKLDLEGFMADVGAIYSQFQILEAVDVSSHPAQRLAHEIEKERLEVDDLLAAIDEVNDLVHKS